MELITDKFHERQIPILQIQKDGTIKLPSQLIPEAQSLMMKSIANAIALKEILPAAAPVKRYFPVPLSYFFNLSHIFCDVYIRINKSHSKPQFVKRINANDEIDKNLLEKIANFGVEYLYVPEEYRKNFMVHFSNQTIRTLQDESTPSEVKTTANSLLRGIIHEQIILNQFGDLVVEMTNESINCMYENLRNQESLSDLLAYLDKSATTLNYRLNCIAALTAHKLMLKIPWATNEHKRKITYACFLSDIFGSEEDLVDAHSGGQLQDHAKKSAELISRYKALPLGLEAIIREHHGDKTGTSIKAEPDLDISPLSRILLLSNDFALLYLLGSEKNRPSHVITSLKEKYRGPEMQKLLQLLKEVF